MNNNNKVILRLENLSKSFGGIRAVNNVNIDIYKGEIHGIIGPNGAGKSTIFKMIMGEYEPTSGKIYYMGNNITKKKVWSRAYDGISIKMQIPGVYKDLTIRDNIRIALQNHVERKNIEEEIDKLITMVDIASLDNPLVKNIPHGMQQRLEIAMAMAPKPKLLLLDEPVAGMGPEETESTAKLVKEIKKMGITVLFIDHDIDFVRKIAERVTVLHYGEVFSRGTIEEIEKDERVKQIYLGNA